MSTQKMTSRCWTCRKRRLKCDGGVPTCQKCWGHGVECLGYEKPLTWVKGVARRGPMKNRSFGELELSSVEAGKPKSAYVAIPGNISVPATLTEPMFANLDHSSRFFIDYFSKRICVDLVLQDHSQNPYRNVITRIRSPAVATAIVTVASCHYIQNLTGSPLLENISSSKDQLSSAVKLKSLPGTLIGYYFQAKELCLKLVSSALLTHSSVAEYNDIVVAVVLLAVLDIFESGSGAWGVHLDGAKKMLQLQSVTGCSVGDKEVQALLNEALTFQILGSSLAKPGVFNSESTLPLTQSGDSSVSSPIGCPVAVLSAIETFALERRFNTVAASKTVDAKHLTNTLQYLRSYDIPVWAMEISKANPVVSYLDLVQLGTIWKLSAEIYASQVLFNLTRDFSFLQPILIDDLIKRYGFLQREEDNLLKCLIWPTFIAGSASIDLQSRDWARNTLERIWQIGHCANTRNAGVVLDKLWKRFDDVQRQEESFTVTPEASGTSTSHKVYNWLQELSLLDGSWLFI